MKKTGFVCLLILTGCTTVNVYVGGDGGTDGPRLGDQPPDMTAPIDAGSDDAADLDPASADLNMADMTSVPDMTQQPDLLPMCVPARGACNATGTSTCCGPYQCAFGIGGPGYTCCAATNAACNVDVDCCPVTGHNAVCINKICTYN